MTWFMYLAWPKCSLSNFYFLIFRFLFIFFKLFVDFLFECFRILDKLIDIFISILMCSELVLTILVLILVLLGPEELTLILSVDGFEHNWILGFVQFVLSIIICFLLRSICLSLVADNFVS